MTLIFLLRSALKDSSVLQHMAPGWFKDSSLVLHADARSI
jgi:hypothetical protein